MGARAVHRGGRAAAAASSHLYGTSPDVHTATCPRPRAPSGGATTRCAARHRAAATSPPNAHAAGRRRVGDGDCALCSCADSARSTLGATPGGRHRPRLERSGGGAATAASPATAAASSGGGFGGRWRLGRVE